MLNLFTRIAHSWSQKPPNALSLTDTPFTLVENSHCYHREPDLEYQVQLKLSEDDEHRRLYQISQLQGFMVDGKNVLYETHLGSLELFKHSSKIWLRWSNTLFELSLNELNHFINAFENAYDKLSPDFASTLWKRAKQKP
ncbi:MAG: hypothetical protein AB7I18_04100 [Candidatus Berkiella sp.]